MTSSVSAPASQRSSSSEVVGSTRLPPAERYEFFRVIQGYLEEAARVVAVPERMPARPRSI